MAVPEMGNLKLNLNKNLDVGSNGCPVVSECRDVASGIGQGDFQKVALNAGFLASYATFGQGSQGKGMQIGAKTQMAATAAGANMAHSAT